MVPFVDREQLRLFHFFYLFSFISPLHSLLPLLLFLFFIYSFFFNMGETIFIAPGCYPGSFVLLSMQCYLRRTRTDESTFNDKYFLSLNVELWQPISNRSRIDCLWLWHAWPLFIYFWWSGCNLQSLKGPLGVWAGGSSGWQNPC